MSRPADQERVSLSSIDPKQLNDIRERLQGELQRLTEGSQSLQRVSMSFQRSSKAIETLSETPEGHPILLPLTSSLYIPGSLTATDKVLIDVGTGYFVEMSTKAAMAHCKRKQDHISGQVQAVGQEIRQKNSQMQQVNAVLQEKMMRQQAAAAAQQQPLQPAVSA